MLGGKHVGKCYLEQREMGMTFAVVCLGARAGVSAAVIKVKVQLPFFTRKHLAATLIWSWGKQEGKQSWIALLGTKMTISC